MPIDWLWVAENFLWILGMSISFTVLGFARTNPYRQLSAWRFGWWLCFSGLLFVIVGFFLSHINWRWSVVASLFLVWMLVARLMNSSRSNENH